MIESPPVSPVIRVLSAAGAVLIALVGLIISFGAILGAPLGIWLVARWTKRHDRRPSGIASLFGAALSSTITAAILWSILFALSHPDRAEFKATVTQSQTRSSAKLPDWYLKTFPQAAQTDSATRAFTDSVTQKMVNSPAFPTLVFAIGVLVLAVFFGSIGGAAGWGSYRLFRIAFLQQRAGT